MELGLCIEMGLTDRPFEQRLKAAATLGFKNVEMWFVDMSYKGTPDRLAQLARKAGVRITNTVIGSPDGSAGGGLVNPAAREAWLTRARQTLAFTAQAGIPNTIVCTGNAIPGMTDAAMHAAVLDGLRRTAELAEHVGVNLLLEPLNIQNHPGYWLTSSDTGATLCRQVGSPRMKLLFDCYHMQIMGGNLVEQIRRNIDVIGHFHMAGVPGRHEIIDNELDYRFIVSQIRTLGYTGVLGLEYIPTGNHSASLRKTIAYLKPVLPRNAVQ